MGSTNLGRAMACFSLTDKDIATILNVDRAHVNRWKNGRRYLNHKSPYPIEIADYLLKIQDPEGNEALQEILQQELALDKFAYELGNAVPVRLVRGLASWLCADSQEYHADTIPAALHDMGQMTAKVDPWPNADVAMPEGDGFITLDEMFQHVMYMLTNNQAETLTAYVRLDGGVLPIGEAFSRFWGQFADGNGGKARIIIAPSSKRTELNQLLSHWVSFLSKGCLTLLSVRDAYPLYHTIFFLEGERRIYSLLKWTQDSEPVCVAVSTPQHFEHLHGPLREAAYAAKPLLTMMTDDDLDRVRMEFYEEFNQPGHFDILKSGLNTMYLAQEPFVRILSKSEPSVAEVENTTRLFGVFQQTMEHCIARDGARELLSSTAIEEMILTGSCTVPGVYFNTTGLVEIGREGIASILRGYATYLEKYPSLEVKVAGESAGLLTKLCWHIKQGRHVLWQTWTGTSAYSLITENDALIREFSKSFRKIWGQVPEMSRDSLIRQFLKWAEEAENPQENERVQ